MIPRLSKLIPALVLLLSILPAIQSAPIRLVPKDAAAGARDGAAVAVDRETLVVGAPDDDAAGPFAGSVYVYTKSGRSWQKQAKLTGPTTTGYRSFGEAVAISRNVIVVGAPFEGAHKDTSGAAYVYIRTGATWTLEAKLTPNDTAENQQFGNAVAIENNTIVVGAYLDSAGQLNAGAAYVFTHTGNRWIQSAKLAASDPSIYAFFGSSVAINNGNIVVGSPISETAYIFSKQNGLWTQRALLTAFDALEGDYSSFGTAVAIDHDTVIIGAPSDGMIEVNAGAAYLFRQQGHRWISQGKFSAPDGNTEDEFGTSVDVSGSMVAVGSPYHGALNHGAVYVFGGKREDMSLEAEYGTGEPGATFLGTAVALTEDAVIAGAPAYREFKSAPAGAAYIFSAQ